MRFQLRTQNIAEDPEVKSLIEEIEEDEINFRTSDWIYEC